MLESFKNRALLLKVETTEGVDAVPTAAADAFQLFDGKAGITAQKIEREIDRPFFTNHPFVNGALNGFIEGGFEIVPPQGAYTGATKASVDALLKTAGMAKTLVAGPPPVVRYNPVSQQLPSGTAYFYHAGTLYRLTGARANISSLTMEIGSYLKGQCRIEGACQAVDEAALPTGLDYSAFATPIVNNTETMEMWLNGVALEGKRMSLDYGNQNQAVEHTLARFNRIRDRRPTFSMLFYRPAKAALDPWDLWKAGTIVTGYGSVVDPLSGLQTRIPVRGQIEEITANDIDGDLGYEIKGRCIATDTGGDEFAIEFSDTTP